MRHVLTLLALALIAVILAAILVPSMIDWNGRRDWLSAQIKAQTGLETRFDGPLSLRLLPNPQIKAEFASVSAGEGLRFKAASLEADLRLMPFLGGQARLQSLTLKAPAIRLDLLALRQGMQHKNGLSIGDLRIENGALDVTRGGTDLASFSALSGRGTYGSDLLRFDGAWTVGGEAQRGGVVASPEKGGLQVKARLSEAGGGYNAEWAGQVGADLASFEGLGALTLNAETSLTVAGPMAFSGAKLKAWPLEGRLGPEETGLPFQASLVAPVGGEAPTLLVTVPNLDLDRSIVAPLPMRWLALAPKHEIKGGLSIHGGRYRGQNFSDVQADFALRGRDITFKKLTGRGPFATQLALSDTRLSDGGRVGQGFVALQTEDFPALSNWIFGRKVEVSEAPQATSLEGRLTWSDDGFALTQMRSKSPYGDASGQMGYSRSNARLFADVKGDLFDLDAMRATAMGAGLKEAEVKLALKRAKAFGQEARNLMLDLSLKDRLLVLRSFKAQGLSGADMDLNGALSLDGLKEGQELTGSLTLHEPKRFFALVPGLDRAFQGNWPMVAPLALKGRLRAGSDGLAADMEGQSQIGPLKLTARGLMRATAPAINIEVESERPDRLLQFAWPDLAEDLQPVRQSARLVLETGDQPRAAFTMADTVARFAFTTGDRADIAVEARDKALLMRLLGLPVQGGPLKLAGGITREGGGLRIAMTAAEAGDGLRKLSIMHTGRERRLALEFGVLRSGWVAASLLGEGVLTETESGLSNQKLVWPPLFGFTNVEVAAKKLATPFGIFAEAMLSLVLGENGRDITLKAEGLRAEARLVRSAGVVGVDGHLAMEQGRWPLALSFSGRGATLAALGKSLVGEGMLTIPDFVVRNLNPDGPAQVLKEAEARMDAGRAMKESEIRAALQAALEPPAAYGPLSMPVQINGLVLRGQPVTVEKGEAQLRLEGQYDAESGLLSSSGRLMPSLFAGEAARVGLPFTLEAQAAEPRADTRLDEALQRIMLRLAERELKRLEDETKARQERERLAREERQRQIEAERQKQAERERQRQIERDRQASQAKTLPESGAPLNIMPMLLP